MKPGEIVFTYLILFMDFEKKWSIKEKSIWTVRRYDKQVEFNKERIFEWIKDELS